MRIRTALLLPALLLGGCDGGFDPTQSGELQRGSFEYVCAGSNDAVCDAQLFATRFPERFAVGGLFTVRFNPNETEGPLPRVESAAPDVLRQDDTRLEFVRPGTVALLALRGDEMIDYVHAQGETVRSLHFTDDAGGDGLVETTLTLGEQRRVFVEPRGELGQVLGGTLAYAWSVQDQTVARIQSDTAQRSVTVVGLSPGRVRLVVDADGVSAGLDLVVLDSDADSDTDESTESSDASTDPRESSESTGGGS